MEKTSHLINKLHYPQFPSNKKKYYLAGVLDIFFQGSGIM